VVVVLNVGNTVAHKRLMQFILAAHDTNFELFFEKYLASYVDNNSFCSGKVYPGKVEDGNGRFVR
jgi:hypothetical protein